MKVALICVLLLGNLAAVQAGPDTMSGVASWYGEEHRDKLMANGQKFDPEKPTAASWFYPLGSKVRVTIRSQPERSVLVTITDRGPAKRLVRKGRIIDLAFGAFKELSAPASGLIEVTVEPVQTGRTK